MHDLPDLKVEKVRCNGYNEVEDTAHQVRWSWLRRDQCTAVRAGFFPPTIEKPLCEAL